MLKKLLCWLLIFQHINIYVLHAHVGDISVVFAREEPEGLARHLAVKPSFSHQAAPSPQPSLLSLKLTRENDRGVLEEVYNGQYQFDKGSFQICSAKKDNLPKDMRLKRGRTLGVISSDPSRAFSIHFCPDGRADLQGMKSRGHVALETFGGIKISKAVGADRLSLKGSMVTNEKELAVNDLNLSTTHSSGTVINSPEGRIKIGRNAHVTRGRFENQGSVEGGDGSVFDLHGNDFANRYLAQDMTQQFRVKMNWQGQFSITNVGHFLNEADILPCGKDADHLVQGSLRIDAKSLLNKSNVVASQGLEVRCLGDLVNEGRFEAGESFVFSVGGSLTNRDKMISSRALIGTVGGNLRNTNVGLISGGRKTKKALIKKSNAVANQGLEVRCLGDLVNEGKLKGGESYTFAVGGSLTNSGKMRSKGTLTGTVGANLYNGKEGLIDGVRTVLTVKGLTQNEGTISSDGLFLRTGKLENYGKVLCKEAGLIQERENGGGLHNREGAEISSQGTLRIAGQTLTNEAAENKRGVIKARDLVTHVVQVENKGDVEATENAELESSSFINTSSGVVRIVREGTLAIGNLKNNGQIEGGALQGTVDTLENFGRLIASTDFVLMINQLLANAEEAIISAVRDLIIKGKGKLQNLGALECGRKADIQAQQFMNSGHIRARSEMSVHTQVDSPQTEERDFTNEGLITAPRLTVTFQRGMNIGKTAGRVNFGELRQAQGILASDFVHFTVGQDFRNEGRVFGKEALQFDGKGVVTNVTVIDSDGCFLSHLRSFENTGHILAAQSLVFDQLTDQWVNTGLVSSYGELSITFPRLLVPLLTPGREEIFAGEGLVLNEGEICSQGRLTIIGQERLDNKGRILGASHGNLMGGCFFNQGFLAFEGSLSASFKKIHHAEGARLSLKEGLTVRFRHFCNQGTIEAGSFVRLMGSHFENATTGSLQSAHFIATGLGKLSENSMVSEAPSFLMEETLSGFPLQEFFINRGTVSCLKTAWISATYTHNQGKILAEGNLILKTHILTNHGQVQANKKAVLQLKNMGTNHGHIKAEHFDVKGHGFGNTPSGKVTATTSDVGVVTFTNRGAFLSERIQGKAEALRNFGTIRSTEDFLFTITTFFENAKGALVSSVKELALKGKAEIQNKGQIESRGILTVESCKLLNSGQINALRDVTISTQRDDEGTIDFENTGLILGQNLSLRLYKGASRGRHNPQINWGDLERAHGVLFEGLQGLLAPGALTLVVGNGFTNLSHLHGGKAVRCTGEGRFINQRGPLNSKPQGNTDQEGVVQSGGTFTSELAGFENAGSLLAPTSIVFTGLRTPFINTRLVSSEGDIALTSRDTILNGEKGIMQGASIGITAQTFTNLSSINAVAGQLTLSVARGENSSVLYGKDGVCLTVGELFTNHRVENQKLGLIEGSGLLVIKGLGRFRNKGFLKSRHDIQLETDFENQGEV